MSKFKSKAAHQEGDAPQADVAVVLSDGIPQEDLVPLQSSEVLEQEDGGSDDDHGERQNEAARVMRLIEQTPGLELFHANDKQAFVSLPIKDRRENLSIESSEFRQWLSHAVYRQERKTLKSSILSDVIPVLGGRAVYEGKSRTVRCRVGGDLERIYVDLGDEDRNIVEIAASGWKLVKDAPIAFIRPKTMKPLPIPTHGGSIERLRPLLNLKSEDDWILLKAYLLNAFVPVGPYLVLNVTGEQGTGKTVMTETLKSLIDPSHPMLNSPPNSERDFVINASKRWLIAFDNMSGVPFWFSDALCRLSTGGGFTVRKLYTDQDETVIDLQRPAILNGISDLASRPDLIERSIILHLARISERQSLAGLKKDVSTVAPEVLGAIFTALSFALRHLESVQVNGSERFIDLIRLVTAAAPRLGFTEEQFRAAYRKNQEASIVDAIEGDPVIRALQQMMDLKNISSWEGTATELLEVFNRACDEELVREKRFPKSPNYLGEALRRLGKAAERVGFEIEYGDDNREAGTGRRLITITRKATRDVVTVVTDEAPLTQEQIENHQLDFGERDDVTMLPEDPNPPDLDESY